MVVLAPLAPALGKLVLAAGKGSLARAAMRSLATGAAFQAGAEIVRQIAEWARSIDGEWDPEDDPNPTDKVAGCRKVSTYGQLYFNDGFRWKAAGQTGNQTLTAQAVEITKTAVRDSGVDTANYAECTFKTVNYGEVTIQEGGGTLAEADLILWKIGLDLTDCEDSGPGPYPDWEPIQLPDQVVDNCTINVTFQGFLGNEDGSGKVQPVFRITPAADARAGGGVIGGCNFEPTIVVGGGGDGDEPPRTYPDPPDEPGSDPWWDAIVRGITQGVTSAVTSAVVNALLNRQEEGTFTLQAPCDVDEEGNALTYTVDFPAESAQDRILRWQVAQAYLLQQHLNWKTPICGNEKPPLEGQWVTTRWKSLEKMVHSGRRLRKLFRYRTKSTRDLGQLSEWWADFTWRAGDVCVRHTGAWWGDPQVWAESEEEGKRVIRHAATEAGIDPDQVGRWATSSSRSPRYGMSGTMTIELYQGVPWISSRGGASFPNVLAQTQDP